MKQLFLLLFTCWICSAALAQESYHTYLKETTGYREHPLDIIKMKLDVAFEPQMGLVKGTVTHTFTVLREKVDSFFFDGPGITLNKATLNGKSIRFSQTAQGFWFEPTQPLTHREKGTLVLTYEANPRKGIYFIGWNLPEPSGAPDPFKVRRQIWTQGQGIDHRHWIPMYDDMNDKFITETQITFDAKYKVLSNGNLLSQKKNKDGSITWSYAMSKPHAGYLLMLAIGNYEVAKAKSKRGVPLEFWHYPEFKDRLEPTFRHSAAMVDFLENETGVMYPWEKYSQVMVQDFLYGAMENTTATIFGDFFFVNNRAYDDRNYVGVNCHELTHQWFGDYITARDGRDTWLQESYATFYPKQFSKVVEGVEEWDWQRRQHQNSAVEAGKKDNYAVRHSAGGTARVYPKGAAVISMLEYVLGSAQWKRALNRYLKEHAYANVETNDLQQAIKDELGLNLDWFFDEWIYRGGEPHFRVHYEDLRYANGSRGTEIAIEQIHAISPTIGAFKMPVVLEVYYKDGSKDSVYEWLANDFEVVKIDNEGNKEIDFVLFDPNSNVLKQLTFKKGFSELSAQLEKAPGYLDRYDAALGMRQIALDKKKAVLEAALKRENHFAIINELLNQLAENGNALSPEIIERAKSHPRSAVRNNLLKTLNCNQQSKSLFEAMLKDSSDEVVKTAMEKLVQAFPENAHVVLNQVSQMGVSGMNHAVDIKRLEWAVILKINAEQNAKELTRFSSAEYEFRTRLLAFESLKASGIMNDEVAGNLLQALTSTNNRLAQPAAAFINQVLMQTQTKQLFKNTLTNSKFSKTEEEIILKLIPSLK